MVKLTDNQLIISWMDAWKISTNSDGTNLLKSRGEFLIDSLRF